VPDDLTNTIIAALMRFGLNDFRPHQEAIVRDALAGHDVLAVLPTGGGKSLCYQLPAVARDGLTVVVSPLIALMKDQVDAMTALDIPATFLNSSIDETTTYRRMRGLRDGRYQLLYVSPERLFMGGFLRGLRQLDVTAIAVDEAHCVCTWGHDFRPEYSRLADLRDVLPDVPVMALSASATGRARDEIRSPEPAVPSRHRRR